jgi:hypothetical protein
MILLFLPGVSALVINAVARHAASEKIDINEQSSTQ